MAKKPFVPLALAFTAGIVLREFFTLPLPALLFLFGVLSLTLLIFRLKASPKNVSTDILIILIFLVMGMIRYGGWQQKTLSQPYLTHLPLQADTLTATVTAVREGERIRIVAGLKSMQRDSLIVPANGKIMVYLPKEYRHSMLPGDRFRLTSIEIDSLPKSRNPGQFDYRRYLQLRGIIARCRVRDSAQVAVYPPTHLSPENRWIAPIRQNLNRRIKHFFPPRYAGFLQALLLGIRDNLSPEIVEDFQKAGVMHLLAISGLHVGYVAIIFSVLLSFFPIYFKYRNIVVMILLLLYMLLTGTQPPVVRATLMTVLFLAGINLERRGHIYNYIFAAAFLILLFQPQQLFWVGFQFSFIAVLSIIFFYDKLNPIAVQVLGHIRNERTRGIIHRWLVMPFLVSASAQLGTIPLTMYYFHLFSPISFFLNLIAIPYAGILVASGFLFLGVSFLSRQLAFLTADWLSQMIAGLFKLVHLPLSLPGSYVVIPRFTPEAILIYASLLFLLVFWKQVRWRSIFGLTSVILGGFWITQVWLAEPALNVMMLDVGQGDATLITTPMGKVVVIDTGPANDYHNAADEALIPTLRYLGKRHINYLFISHPHRDHCGGIFRLAEYADIDSCYLAPLPVAYPPYDSLCRFIQHQQMPFRYLRMGDVVQVDGVTRIYVLGPPPETTRFVEPTGDNINNNSLVLLVKYGEVTMLFPGDAEKEAETYLEKWGDLLKSQLLKVGHHGSNTSTTEDFLSLISPQIATISVGAGNKFGHPDPGVIKRLRAYHVQVFRTDRQRALWFRWQRGKWKRVRW